MTTIGDITIPETEVRVIHNPEKVINLICDLPDGKTLLHMLEIVKTGGEPGKMMYRHPKLKMYMLLLYRYPKWMEPEDVTNTSEIVIFVASKLSGLIKFFYIWFNKEQDHDHKTILFEVNDLLYEHQRLERERSLRPQY